MAYVGGAWRTSGYVWRKTENGWKTVDATRVTMTNPKEQPSLPAKTGKNESDVNQPTRYISIFRNSRELSYYRSLGDVMDKLDLNGALHDYSRFLYVCKIIQEIVEHKLLSLGSSSLTYLYNLIDNAVKLGITFLLFINNLISEYNHLIGSLTVWKDRLKHLRQCELKLTNDEVNISSENDHLQLMDIPDDCLQYIILFLSDHRDIISLSGVNKRLNYFTNESYTWRKLCQYHFRKEEIEKYSEKDYDWKSIFKILYKKYGIRQDSECKPLYLCDQCGFVYWQKYGHPCSSIIDFAGACTPLTARKLISLFST
ncbi:F-box only protein 25 [Trichoplax sp. H2]|nr:F-box only protein 25 [Trichoplax sp. H2]|eukprot:RDD46158.1 F-box only protein 25 [Trichoplax sp. H2]